LEGNIHSLNKGKRLAAILLKTLSIAKIKPNLYAGKFAGSIPSEHSHGQVLVEPLLLPGVA